MISRLCGAGRLGWCVSLCILSAFSMAAQPRTRLELAEMFRFEGRPPGSLPSGWTGSPGGAIGIDEGAAHGVRPALRLTRTTASAGASSTLGAAVPLDFAGDVIEIRAFLKTGNVSGSAALWLRLEGDVPDLPVAAAAAPKVEGTSDWTEYRVSLPATSNARTVAFGVALNGSGTVWASDFSLLVDGKPAAESPTRPSTAIDDDHEFDGGSRISLTALSANQVANLTSLAKVWGFLKYSHPAVTAGRYHWDYELFRILPRVLSAADRTAANQTIATWVTALGNVPACTRCITIDPTLQYLAPGLAWLADESLLGRELSQMLQAIDRNRGLVARTFYVSQAAGVGNAVFENEPSYPNLKLPDSGYQLLALFRFWNMVECFYPYRELMADDPAAARTYWDTVLRESIPAIGLAASSTAYRQELLKFIARIHDTQANLWNALEVRPPGGDCQLPAELRFVEGQAVVVRPGKDSGANDLRAGDAIEELDGVAVSELVNRWRPFYAASNESGRLRDIAANLTRGACVPANLAVRRGNDRLRLTAARVPAGAAPSLTHDRPGATFQKLSEDVAYLKLSTAESGKAGEYVAAAAGTKALILDLRSRPADNLTLALGALLAPQSTDFARWIVGSVISPGFFWWQPPQRLTPREPRYAGRVVVLVDELTEGGAEYAAMAFRSAPDAIVVGSRTAGANGNRSTVPLPGGLNSAISGIGAFYPDKRPTQRVGIALDVEVKPTIEGVAADRDEVLDEALRRIEAGWNKSNADPTVIEFVPIAPGEFYMGCSLGATQCLNIEGPRHLVKITVPFELGKYEVTQAQWEAVMSANQSAFRGPGLPVDSVSRTEVLEFLKRLNDRNDGYRYRLPTEAEWEYAARAGSTDQFGGGAVDDVAWFADNFTDNSAGRSHAVGTKKPNAWGLYDMLGNLAERIQDLGRTYTAETQIDPVGTIGNLINRGGFWSTPASVSRRETGGEGGGNGNGFRVARERGDGQTDTPGLKAIDFSVPAVRFGEQVTGTVTLDGPAPPEGTLIGVSTGDSVVVRAQSLFVGKAKSSANFTVTPATVSALESVAFTATLAKTSKTAMLLLSPPPGPVTGPFGIEFLPVSLGEFNLGCPRSDSACQPAERPSHPVRLTKPFEIGRFEVTQAQWEAVMTSNPSSFRGPDLPVEQVSWTDVQSFLTRLNGRNDGYRYRLPTEAEWEYAARGAKETAYAGPDSLQLAAFAWIISNSDARSHPVGTRRPADSGAYDLLGNVAEWVQDWYAPYPSDAAVDPVGPATGTAKVIRGASWSDDSRTSRVAFRNSAAQGYRSNTVGFRCVRERVDGKAAPAALSQLVLGAASAFSGESVKGRIVLSGWAPPEGVTVRLETNAPDVFEVPATVTLSEGFTTAAFTASVRGGTAGHQVTLTARLGNDSRTASLTLAPPRTPRDGPFDMKFVDIYPGEFVQGCSPGDTGCASNEKPRWLVRLTKPFAISAYETTQAQWEALMGSNPSSIKGADLPVDYVSWNDAQTFLARLNARNDGYRYRLPTEAEWEYAARAGTDDQYAGGALDDIAWSLDNSGERIHPVGQRAPNPWGLFDMLGNVYEWTQDSYEPYVSSAAVDPLGVAQYSTVQASRVVRGGGAYSFGAYSSSQSLAVSRRLSFPTHVPNKGMGLRLVRERLAP